VPKKKKHVLYKCVIYITHEQKLMTTRAVVPKKKKHVLYKCVIYITHEQKLMFKTLICKFYYQKQQH